MTAPVPAPITARRSVARTLAMVALVVVAAVVEMLPAPAIVRSVFAFPVLVLVTGHSLTRLVLDGWRPEHSTGPDRAGGDLDGLLRVVLPVLLGVLSLLAAVLALSAFGIAIGTRSAAVVVGGVGVGLSVLALPSRTRSGAGPGRVGLGRISLPGTTVVLAATVVMGVALIGAVTLRPVPVLPYAQISLDDPGVVAGSPLSAAPGASVPVHWVLRGYGGPLSLDPSVDVTVAGRPVPVTSVDAVGDAPAADGADVQRGAVRFAAPVATGLYDLRVRVGTNTPAPSVLVLRLRVGA